jgi:hypothetical protein
LRKLLEGTAARMHKHRMGVHMDFFFVFWSFLIKIREMNPAETYFQNLARCSRACPIDVTYEGVVPYALV